MLYVGGCGGNAVVSVAVVVPAVVVVALFGEGGMDGAEYQRGRKDRRREALQVKLGHGISSWLLGGGDGENADPVSQRRITVRLRDVEDFIFYVTGEFKK